MSTRPPPARKPPRFSLRLKLTLYLTAVAVMIQVLLGVVVLFYQYTTIDGFFDTRIEARVNMITSRFAGRESLLNDEELARAVADRPRLVLFENGVATLFLPTGEVVASTVRPAPPFELTNEERAAKGAKFVAFRRSLSGVVGPTNEETRARVAIRQLNGADGSPLILLFAADDWNFDVMVRVMLGVFVAASAMAIVAWGVAAWVIAGLAMAPLRHLRLVAGSFSPESIEKDIELPSDSAEIAALEQDLREARLKLRTALHAQDRFISSVSHELNTPIAVLLTEAQTLPPETLSPEARAFARSVTEEMKRLGRMVGSFLTLTRVRGGQSLTVARPYDVNDVVIESVHQCGPTAAQRGVRLAPQLAEDESSLYVTGDGELLRIMLDNLVRNAIRFSPPRAQVVIAVARRGDQCEISVRDFGRGIPASLMPSLFDRFTQGPEEAGEGRGHGLGLSIAQGIAELHAGRISVRNLDSGGCEFVVRLPLAPEAMPTDPAPSPDAGAETKGQS